MYSKNATTLSSEVPQGSILGPLLWNIPYDNLLETKILERVELVGFADDLAVVVVAQNEQMLMNAYSDGWKRRNCNCPRSKRRQTVN